MDYIWFKIAGLALFGLGWFFGYSSSNKRIGDIEKGMEFLEKSSEVIDAENKHLVNVENQVRLLIAIDDSDINLAQEHLIEDLGAFFLMSKETIEENMASDEEKTIVERIKNLAKDHDLFKQVIEYTE